MTKSNKLAQPILARLTQKLRPLGFRRRGQTFVSEHEGVSHLIQLQNSRSSTASQLITTVNVGAVCPQILFSWESAYTYSSAHWGLRIGFLSAERRDLWWTVESEEDANRAADEILQLLEDAGLPALGGITTIPEMFEKVSKEPKGLTLRRREEVLRDLAGLMDGEPVASVD